MCVCKQFNVGRGPNLLRVGLRAGCLVLVGLLAGCLAPTAWKEPPATQSAGAFGFFSSSFADLINTPATRPAGASQAEPQLLEAGEKSTLIYPVRYARTDTLRDAIAGLVNPDGTVQDSAPLNALIIQDKRDTVQNILRVLQNLDRPVPQLLVEARVVEVTLNDDLEYEIQHTLTIPNSPGAFLQNSSVTLKTPGANPTDGQGAQVTIRPWASNDIRLDNYIRLLQTKGKANILSSPNLIVSPGTEASIITGEEVPIQSTTVVSGSLTTNTLFKRVGIKLRVNLLQLTTDTARIDLNPEVSTVTGYTQVSAGVSNPIISLRNVTSTLTLKDGETLTVGGLLQDEDQLTTEGIPLLQDIPYAGYLFQSQRHTKVKTQLIFFIRVHIMPEGVPEGLQLHKPGAGFEKIDDAAVNGAQTRPAVKDTVSPNTKQP